MTDSRYDDTNVGFWEKTGVANDDSVRPDRGQDIEVWADKFAIIDPTDETKRVLFSVASLATATDRTVDPATGVGRRRSIVSGEANLTLSADISGALVLMNDATQAFVLPAATAALTGVFWEFQSTVAATTTTITALAGDLYSGGVIIQSDTATAGDYFAADGSNDVIITLNGGTTGGALGGRLLIECGGLDLWLVSGVLHGVGATMSTPFS